MEKISKKAKKQVVRFIYFLLFTFVNSTFGQNINGKYITKELYTDTYYVPSKEFTYYNDHTFNVVSGSDYDHSIYISKGYYLVKSDSLILCYDSIAPLNGLSSYTIEKKKDSSKVLSQNRKINVNALSLSIETYDYYQNIIPSVTIALMSGEETLSVSLSDTLGSYHLYTTGKIADKLYLWHMGYKSITIDLKNFWGYSSKAIVKFAEDSPYKYNTIFRIEKYLIKEHKSTFIVLENVISKNIIVLHKM